MHSALGRDVKPGQLPALAQALAAWLASCEASVTALAARRAAQAQAAQAEALAGAALAQRLEAVRKSVKAELEVRGVAGFPTAASLPAGVHEEEMMDGEDGEEERAGGGGGGGTGRPKRRR